MRDSLLLRKSENPTAVSFHLYYERGPGLDPERYLIEKDLLAPLFDSQASPLYLVECGNIRGEFRDFGEALARYYDLVIRWKAIEVYVHPTIFRYDKRWVEGVQYPL